MAPRLVARDLVVLVPRVPDTGCGGKVFALRLLVLVINILVY